MNQHQSVTAEAVLITGGASGIGLTCARQAAARGARVAIVDINPSAAADAVATLEGHGHLAIAADVTDADAMRSAADQFADGGSITGVVAAAGIVSRLPLLDIDVSEFRRVLDINVIGVQNTISAAGPHLIRAGALGTVVVLGSAAAFTGGGLMGNGAYATSKAALIGLVRGYARELAPHRVRVNMVAPGATETPMTDVLSDTDRDRIAGMSLLGRLSKPEEIAAAIAFLLAPDAGTITGQILHVNGGVVFG
ncbi:SDR family NAD(P)-dependent oxidoreductase [Pseudarthrobacter sulfonivorans]|uniref:SDR family NAD(P)-dependent oxidoreductase n=1 Tax=Pseudarthrobacter sulfonivorans TaxID=121292 RepID=UPI000A8649CF|nr:SDR family oxidoreductase [Pseudarthrobacter sulfonivorans]